MTLLMSKKLKYFIASYETQCINNAAELLCITRSPLIRVLCELEDRSGEKLFTRKYNQLKPTERAHLLYKKIKPVYDLLCGIENEFMVSGRTVGFELLCDFSVPYVIYQHICSKLRNLPQSVSCRRVCVSTVEIQTLTANPETALLSYRKLSMPKYFTCYGQKEESLFLLLPDHLDESDISNFAKMENIKLFIRKDTLSSEVKGFISRAVMNFIPNVNIHETDDDTASLLLYVSMGEGMLLLPECLAGYFTPPRTRKIKIPDIYLMNCLYINNRNKNKKFIECMSAMLTPLTE